MAMAAADPVWTLGDRMWKARKFAGLEQTDVAERLGVSRALVSRWERDLSDPGTRQLREFAEMTGVSTAWLMWGGAESAWLQDSEARQLALWPVLVTS